MYLRSTMKVLPACAMNMKKGPLTEDTPKFINKKFIRHCPMDIDNEPVHIELDDLFFISDYRTEYSSREEFKEFQKKYSLFSKKDLEETLKVPFTSFMELVNQMVPCVRCRSSIETFYKKTAQHEFLSLYPMEIDKESNLCMTKTKQTIEHMCTYFMNPGEKYENVIELCDKGKVGRRCPMHLNESQKLTTPNAVRDAMGGLPEVCQDIACRMSFRDVRDSIVKHIQTYRFCGECETRIWVALDILLSKGKVDVDTNARFSDELYRNLSVENKYISVHRENGMHFKLIDRTLSQLAGRTGEGERCAKTMFAAQVEVLVCIGLCLVDRVQKFEHRLREELRAFEMVLGIGHVALRRSFDLTLEKKRGVSELELLCMELNKEERRRQVKKERKKRKKSKKAEASKEKDDSENEENEPEETEETDSMDVNNVEAQVPKEQKREQTDMDMDVDIEGYELFELYKRRRGNNKQKASVDNVPKRPKMSSPQDVNKHEKWLLKDINRKGESSTAKTSKGLREIKTETNGREPMAVKTDTITKNNLQEGTTQQLKKEDPGTNSAQQDLSYITKISRGCLYAYKYTDVSMLTPELVEQIKREREIWLPRLFSKYNPGYVRPNFGPDYVTLEEKLEPYDYDYWMDDITPEELESYYLAEDEEAGFGQTFAKNCEE